MTLIEQGNTGSVAAVLTDTATMTNRSSGDAGPTGMRVKKRNGTLEPVDLNKIVNASTNTITVTTTRRS